MEKRAHRAEYLLSGDHWYVLKQGQWGNDEAWPSWRERLVYNDTLIAIENRIAKLTRNERVWGTSIRKTSLADRMVARTISQVLDAYWDSLDMPAIVEEAMQWAMSSTVVFGIPYWDRTAGPSMRTDLKDWLVGAESIPNPKEREEYIRLQANRFFQLYGIEAMNAGFWEGPAGDFRIDIAPVFEMNWWPRKPKRWKDVRLWCRSVVMPCEQAAERLDMPVEEVRKYTVPYGSNETQSEWGRMYFEGQDTDQTLKNDCIRVHTLERVADRQFPKGRQCIAIGPQFHVVAGPSELQNPLYVPMVFPLMEKPIRGGNLMGTCTVDQIEPAQRDKNVSLSQASDYRNSRICPTLVDFEGNSQNGEGFVNAPGRVYRAVDPNHVPVAVKMPDVPIDHFQMAQQDSVWISNASGTPSIDVGRTDQANVRSGRAITALQTANDARLKGFAGRLDTWVSDLGNAAVAFLQANIRVERCMRIIGSDAVDDIVAFKGSDLQPSNYGKEGYDPKWIRCTAYSIIPRSPEAMTNFVSMALTPDATGRSLLDPEKDKGMILDMLGMNHLREAFDRDRLDQIGVRRLIKAWESLMPGPAALEVYNDKIFIDEIERWMKGDDYRAIANAVPIMAQVVSQRLELHKINLARKNISPMYEAARATTSLWMQHRTELLNELSRPDPKAPPEQNKAKAEMAQVVVNLVFPVPIGIAPPVAPEEQDEKGSGKKPKQDKSHNQGVSKSEQNGE